MLVQIRPIYGFIIGALLASIYPLWILLLTPFLLIAVLFKKQTAFSLVITFVVGVIWVSLHWALAEQNAWPEPAGKTQQILKGEVRHLKRLGNKVEFDFQTDSAFHTLKVSCFYCKLVINQGDQWQFDLRIKPIHSFQNPKGFDYRRWMLSKGYSAQAYVHGKSEQNHRIFEAQQGIAGDISQLVNPNSFPFLRALVLGDKSSISIEDKRLLYGAGISHLFVVSGLHVGIVAALVGVLLYWLQRPLLLIGWHYAKEVALIAAVSVSLVYGVLTGFEVPAFRAVIMLLCASIFLISIKNIQPIYYLVFAFICVIYAYPLAFMDMGSWLSFSIVMALIMGFSGGQKQNVLLTLLKAQWLALCMGSLVLLGFSQSISPASFVINLILVPIFSILIMPLVLLAVIYGLIINDSVLQVMEAALRGLFDWMGQFESILTWWLPIHEANSSLVIIALILFLMPTGLAFRWLAVVGLGVGLCMPLPRPELGGFKLITFDVGQGSAALIQTQNRNVLVDTGAQFSSGLTLADMVLLPYFRRHNIRQLDLLHLTHTDNDHSGGKDVLQKLSLETIEQNNCQQKVWTWDGVLFERFQALDFQQGNNGSCLLKVTAEGQQSILFAGDIEQEAEAQLVEQFGKRLAATVLMAPHHGSRTSSTNLFLLKVDAELAIISAGFLNRYHHPHEQTLNKYAELNMTAYTTAEKGAIQVEFPARQAALVVSTYRP